MLDLWSEKLASLHPDENAPVNILRQQAALLGQKTRNLIEAEVVRPEITSLNREFVYDFYLVSRPLNYYFRLFTIGHNIDIYPVLIELDGSVDAWKGDFSEVKLRAYDENKFIEILKDILGAKRTLKIIQTILSQVDINFNDTSLAIENVPGSSIPF